MEYIFTNEVFGTAVPRMRRKIEDKVHDVEMALEHAVKEQILISCSDAEEMFGVAVATRLLERYGAKRVVSEDDQHQVELDGIRV